MEIFNRISHAAVQAVKACFDKDLSTSEIQVQETRKDFDGDYTIVTFPLTRHKLGNPVQIGEQIGAWLVENSDEVAAYNVIKGFLNLTLSGSFWVRFLRSLDPEAFLTLDKGAGRNVMVEFSSPNTNKPLHVGHLRNNFIGYSICKILEACGYKVTRVCLVNDKGIAISKSMLMYDKSGRKATPELARKKPDQFVVEYYVQWGVAHEAQVEALTRLAGMEKEEAKEKAPVMSDSREMLLRWENGDEDIRDLWQQLNTWVYEGFDQTYKRMGVAFDKIYYESETFKLGNDIVEEGLEKGVFQKREDGTVFIDLEPDGLDKKVVRRADGTTVYITQDFGTAVERHKEYGMDRMIYVVGNEQDYHFKVLFLILKKLGYEWAEEFFHLSYGMVELPGGMGRIKTRSGVRRDADDLMDEVVGFAREKTSDEGKTEGMSHEELEELYEKIGMAALKYFMLKVQAKKKMIFDPAESVELNGNTGPFIQYSYARTRSLRRKWEEKGISMDTLPVEGYSEPHESERELLKVIASWPEALNEAEKALDPSPVANHAYEMAREYNRFWRDCPVLRDDVEPAATRFRFELSEMTSQVLKFALDCLGIEVPERM